MAATVTVAFELWHVQWQLRGGGAADPPEAAVKRGRGGGMRRRRGEVTGQWELPIQLEEARLAGDERQLAKAS